MKGGMREYGGIAAAIGLLGLFVGTSLKSPDLSMVGSVLLVAGAVMVYFTLDQWYCQMCGQKLGRVVKPKECERCGSNRMTKRDPGVGDAVRVKR